MNKINSKVFIVVMLFSLFFASDIFSADNIELGGVGIRSDGKGGEEIYQVPLPSYPVKPAHSYPVGQVQNNGNHYSGNECVVLKGLYDNVTAKMSKKKSNTNRLLQTLKKKRGSKQEFSAWCKKHGMSVKQAVKKGYNGKWWNEAIDKQSVKVRNGATAEMKTLQTDKRAIVEKYNRLCAKGRDR